MKNLLWPALLLLTIVLCAVALLPQTSGFSSFRSEFLDRPSPIVQAENGPIAKAVYLVVIDGLRYDVSQSKAMPYLNQLKNRAAWGKAYAGMPSYSRPGYERILSGAPAELTGLTMNDQTGASPVPTIFSLAVGAGLKTAASAHYWIRELADGPIEGPRSGRVAGENITYGYFYLEDDPDSRVFAAATEFIRTDDPNFVLVLPMSIDEAGHQYGGRSIPYRKSAAAIDALLEDFFRSLPNTDYLAIVTADHGHRNAGGHGGEEQSAVEIPLFIFGGGVRPGRINGRIDQLDLAPTIAAALGTPMAGGMGGRVLTEAFTDRARWEAREQDLLKAQKTFLSENAGLLGGSTAGFSKTWARARNHSLLVGVLWRLPLALVLAAAIVLASVYLIRSLKWRWPVLAGVAFPLYFYALLRLVRYDYSYSAIVTPGDFLLKAILAAALSLFILTWAGAGLRRGRESFFSPISFGAWSVQGLLTILAWVIVGGGFHRFLPDLGWQVFLMVQLLVTVIVSLYALIGWVVIQLVRGIPATAAGGV